ncbi:MAG: STAS-like domain-containing protein, partial [Aquincola sp.]|nr:STAS-like domain-containing protein [Aquincola sp.]
GIFRKIARALDLPDERQALLELSKGKFTTDPTRHSGEGVFFTSRMFDQFLIQANDLRYAHLSADLQDRLDEVADAADGTIVFMSIAADSTRTTREIFDQYTSGPDDFTFDKTVVPMRLAKYGTEQLVSRSQAKRLIARFDRFKIVVLDFEGVDSIGQGFADELFRVYARAHPDIRLETVNAGEDVLRMVRRVTAAG